MTKTRKLNSYVHVKHPETEEMVAFGPEDQVPDWAVEAITNPDVWVDNEETAEAEVPGPGQFPNEPNPTAALTKTELYKKNRDELVAIAEEAGVHTQDSDTKKDLVEAILAR